VRRRAFIALLGTCPLNVDACSHPTCRRCRLNAARIIPDTGHHVQQERAAEVNAAAVNFLSTVWLDQLGGNFFVAVAHDAVPTR
jgi:hypothetical protein